MGYNPFDFLGADKRQGISAKATDVASDIVNENKLKEIIRGMVREAIKGHKSKEIPYIGKYDKNGKEISDKNYAQWKKSNKSKKQENLKKWFSDKWVNIGKKDKSGKHPPCGTSGKTRAYAKCVPKSKAASMSKKDKESATRRKRAAQNKAGRGGTSSTRGGGKKPIRVNTKPKK